LRTKIQNSQLKEGENCVYEVIIDGATEDAVKKAIKVGIQAATTVSGINRITAGNYGGKLGKYQYKLHELGLG
jgi:formylmethanofuran--tetrahydromethanopterin N-formyltransferase